MKLHRTFSNLVLATSLIAAPFAASAEPAPLADADRYAELEKQSPAAATFEGGGDGVYIGGSLLTVVLVLLLIVIIL